LSELRFAKINFLVRDGQAAFDYALNVLGAKVVAEPHEMPIGSVSQVDLHGLVMEFIQPPRGSRMDGMIDRRGEGMDSVGFATDDVPGAVKAIEGRGGRFAQTGDAGLANTAWLHPRNPLSLSIELFNSELSGSPEQT